MSIPTVNVTVVIRSQDGNPIANASVRAVLQTTETYDGYVVPKYYNATTDETGTAILSVFPNEIGSEGSEYKFTIFNPLLNKSVTISAVIPNHDCNLWEVADLPPYDRTSIVNTFKGLLDTPSSYAGQANKMLAVKPDETGIDYISAGSGMGDMMKSIYDTNDNGIVDKAEEAEAIDGGTF